MQYVRDLSRLTLADADEAGGEGANLGELTRAGLPVPAGFVVLRSAYFDAICVGGVLADIAAGHAAALRATTQADFESKCEALQELVHKAGITHTIQEEIRAHFRELGAPVVEVRSSAIGENGASFATTNASFTTVSGEDELIEAVTSCWASLFSPRAETYRAHTKFERLPAMGVVVQQVVAAERSGVMLTVDPRTGNRDELVIDNYVIDKATQQVVSVRSKGEHVLSDAEAAAIARLGIATEKHYGSPQEIEWSIGARNIWLVGTSPIA